MFGLVCFLMTSSDLFCSFIRQGCKHKLQGLLILILSVISSVECHVLVQIWYVCMCKTISTFIQF